MYVFYTMLVITFNILSNKCISWYNTHKLHKLLHVSPPGCHPQGVITTKVHKPNFQCTNEQRCISQPANIKMNETCVIYIYIYIYIYTYTYTYIQVGLHTFVVITLWGWYLGAETCRSLCNLCVFWIICSL